MSLLGYWLDGLCDWSWGWVSVGCVMFLGMGVGVPYVTVWLGVVIGSCPAWWVWIVGLDSDSVWGYEILAWLSDFSVLVCGDLVVGYDLV